MARYVLEIEITGGAEAKLLKISEGVTKVAAAAGHLHNASGKAGHAVEELSHKAHGHFLDEFGEKLGELGESFKDFAEVVVESAKEIMESLIETASEFEDIRSSFEFSFGENAQNMFDKTYEESKHLALTFKQTSDMVANLGRAGINAFGGFGDEIEKFKGKRGDMLSMVEVLQDTMSGLGIGFGDAQRFMKGIEHAMIGNFKMIQMYAPHKVVDEMKKAFSSAGGDIQKSAEGITKVLANMFGGATKLKENNFSYQVQQIHDKIELLKKGLMDGSLPIITAGLKAFQEALLRLIEDKEAMGAFNSAIRDLSRIGATAFRWTAQMIDWLREIVKTAPWLPKLTLGIIAITAAASAFLGVLFGISSILTAIVATFIAVGWEAILAVGIGMVALLPAIGILATVIVGIGAALKATADIADSHWGGTQGVFSIFEKGRVLFEALGEAFNSFDGQTSQISVKTAGELKKMGLWDFFLRAESAIYKANAAWDAFIQSLDDMGVILGPELIPLFEEVLDLFRELGISLGVQDAAMRGVNGSTNDWITIARDAAHIIAELGRWVVRVTRFFVALFRVMNDVKDFFFIVWIFRAIIGTIELLINTLSKLSRAWDIMKDQSSLGLVMNIIGHNSKKQHPLFHNEANVTKPEVDINKSSDSFLNQFRNATSDKDKRALVNKFAEDNQLDPAQREQMLSQFSPYKKGMDYSRWYEAPVSLAPTQTPIVSGYDASTLGGAPPGGTSKNGPTYDEEQVKLREAIVALAQRPISVQINGKEVARAVQDEGIGRAGR